MRYAKTLLLAVGIGLFAVFLWNLWPIEPSYKGHRLSEWLELYGAAYSGHLYTTNTWASKEDAEAAIRNLGYHRAGPFMLRWIQFIPISHHAVIETNRDQPVAVVREILNGYDQEEFRAEGIVAAFGILGSNAASSMPELARIASIPHRPDWQNADPIWGLECPSMPDRRAIFALANMGPEAMPYLLKLATNQSVDIQCDAVYLLSRMGTNALPAIPLLVQDIQNPSNRVAYMAARTVGDLRLSPQTVIPALTNALEHRRVLPPTYWTNGTDPQLFFYHFAFASVAAYGAKARPALPTLLAWLNKDQDPFLPQKAADALGKLALEPEVVVPALTKALDSRNPELVCSAAQSLGAYGPSATPAVPALIRVFNTKGLIWHDRHIIEEALKRITNSVPSPVSGLQAK